LLPKQVAEQVAKFHAAVSSLVVVPDPQQDLNAYVEERDGLKSR